MLVASTSGALGQPGTGSRSATAPDPPTFYSTATVTERPVDEATNTVTVVDREAIEASGASGVVELLQSVPGLFLEEAGTRGGSAVARIRGGDPNYTLVLLDGVPLNDGTYPIGDVFDLGALPAAAVERIEVVRGPVSAFYGSSGLAGAIHIFTRRGSDNPEAEIAASAGNSDLRRVEGRVSGAAGRARYFLSALGDREESRIADERFRQQQAQGRLDLEGSRGRSLRMTMRAARWESDDYPEASGGPVYGSGELRASEHRELSLGLDLEWGEDDGSAKQRWSLGVYEHRLDRASPAIGFLVPRSEEATRWTRSRLGWMSTRHSGSGVRLATGVTVDRERAWNRSLLFLAPELGEPTPGDYSRTRTTPGAFAEASWSHGSWHLDLGSRLDHLEDDGLRFSPRLGLAFRPAGASWRLRASAGESFKLPSFFALASPGALGGNADLRTETLRGFDLGVELSLRTGQLALTAFHHRYRNLVDFDFASFRHINRGRVVATGLELEGSGKLTPALELSAALTWQDAEDQTSEQPLLHRPEWTGALRLTWQPRPTLDLDFHWRWTSSRFDNQLPVPEIPSVDGYSVSSLGARWRLSPDLRLETRLDNLFDRDYQTQLGFPGPGRSGRIGLRWRLGGDDDERGCRRTDTPAKQGC